MKIININNNLLNTRKYQAIQAVTPIKNKTDKLSFTGKNKREDVGFLNKIRSLFKKEITPEIACATPGKNLSDLSEEEKTSEEIKNFIANSIQCYDTMTDYGKTSATRIKKMLLVGKQFDYKGYIPYGRENLTFGHINEETGIPKNISNWKNGKYMRTYEIEETSPELKYKITTNENNIKTEYTGVNSDIIYMKQTDNNKHSFFAVYKTKSGFSVISGISNGNEEQALQRLNFDFYDYKWSFYFVNSDEGMQLYSYNPDKNMWVFKTLLASEIMDEE